MNKVGVIMGSKSDFPVMEKAVNILKELEVGMRFMLYQLTGHLIR